MASSLFRNLPPSRLNNPLQMLAEFKKFARGMTPQKAEQEIIRLLQSGQMSPQQFEQLKEPAQDFMQFLK